MCVYMYIFICMCMSIVHGHDTNVRMHAEMHAHMHVRRHAYIPAQMHACIHGYKHTCIHTFTQACIHTYTFIHMHACVHACVRACMSACMHACMHACINAYTHVSIYAYMYTCIHMSMLTIIVPRVVAIVASCFVFEDWFCIGRHAFPEYCGLVCSSALARCFFVCFVVVVRLSLLLRFAFELFLTCAFLVQSYSLPLFLVFHTYIYIYMYHSSFHLFRMGIVTRSNVFYVFFVMSLSASDCCVCFVLLCVRHVGPIIFLVPSSLLFISPYHGREPSRIIPCLCEHESNITNGVVVIRKSPD